MSSLQEVHHSLSRSATPNTAWTDNPVYWNKYERAAVGLPADVSHLTETCLTCSELFVPEVAGQSFCSEECYVPPCSICSMDYGFLPGDVPSTRGLHLCAGCYWDADWEWKHRSAEAERTAPEGEVQYIFPGEPEYDDSHEEEYSEEDSQADYPPTKKEMLESGGVPNRRHIKTETHRQTPEPPSSSNAAAGGHVYTEEDEEYFWDPFEDKPTYREEITEEIEEENYREMLKFHSFINKVRSHLKKMPKNP
jgi:hypothetical protein